MRGKPANHKRGKNPVCIVFDYSRTLAQKEFPVGLRSLLRREPHHNHDPAIFRQAVHRANLALLIDIISRRKIALAKLTRAISLNLLDFPENITVSLAEVLGNFSGCGNDLSVFGLHHFSEVEGWNN